MVERTDRHGSAIEAAFAVARCKHMPNLATHDQRGV